LAVDPRFVIASERKDFSVSRANGIAMNLYAMPLSLCMSGAMFVPRCTASPLFAD
jgi:hypothetical protein